MEVKLSEIAGGALQEKVDKAISEILDNMLDPNTPWKPARVLSLKLKLTQNEERNSLDIDISVEKKLASVKPVHTQAYIGKDLDTGQVYFEEYGNQIRGQMSINDMDQLQRQVMTDGEGRRIDTDTGEIIGEKLIDFQKRAQ